MKPLLRAIADEARLVFGDWGVLLISAAAIVIYSFFYPVPYTPEVLRDVPVAIVDDDGSGLSRTFVRMLDAHDAVRVSERCATVAEAETIVREGRVAGLVVVRRGFARDIITGQQAKVSASLDSSYMFSYGFVLKGVLEATGTLSAGIEMSRARAQGKSAEAAARQRQPLSADLRPLFNPSGGYGMYVIPAVLVLVLQQTLLIGAGIAGGTLNERRETSGARPTGSFGAALLQPLAEALGRAVPYLALYAVNATFCFGFALPYHGYHSLGHALDLALVMTPFIVATTFLALGLRGLFHRRETAIQVMLFTSLPFIFLGAFSWPPEAVPAWLQAVARLVPTTSAIPAVLRITRMGAGLGDVIPETTTLWALALLYLPFACWSHSESVYTRTKVNGGAYGVHPGTKPSTAG